MKLQSTYLSCITAIALSAPAFSAAIIFDNFNLDEGRFADAPNFSGTTVGESASSTADRVTTDGPLEGEGHQRLVFVHDGSGTNMRIRFLSGRGSPANNLSFTTGPDVDGFIGFYLKTTAQDFTVGINLDGAGNTIAEMDMGINLPVIGDGEWHLYEWDLDDVENSWETVTAIGGDGTLQDGSHTIDSIYFFSNQTGGSEQAQPAIYFDFVAKSDSGSIAALVPEPTSLSLLLCAGGGLFASRRRKRAK